VLDVSEVAVAEAMPRLEGNQMSVIRTGRPGRSKPAAAAGAAAPAPEGK
jgi:hypothetical protein